MIESKNINEILDALIGPCEAVGDEAIDTKNLKNLEVLINVIDHLEYKLWKSYNYSKDSPLDSYKRINKKSKDYIKSLLELFKDVSD